MRLFYYILFLLLIPAVSSADIFYAKDSAPIISIAGTKYQTVSPQLVQQGNSWWSNLNNLSSYTDWYTNHAPSINGSVINFTAFSLTKQYDNSYIAMQSDYTATFVTTTLPPTLSGNSITPASIDLYFNPPHDTPMTKFFSSTHINSILTTMQNNLGALLIVLISILVLLLARNKISAVIG